MAIFTWRDSGAFKSLQRDSFSQFLSTNPSIDGVGTPADYAAPTSSLIVIEEHNELVKQTVTLAKLSDVAVYDAVFYVSQNATLPTGVPRTGNILFPFTTIQEALTAAGNVTSGTARIELLDDKVYIESLLWPVRAANAGQLDFNGNGAEVRSSGMALSASTPGAGIRGLCVLKNLYLRGLQGSIDLGATEGLQIQNVRALTEPRDADSSTKRIAVRVAGKVDIDENCNFGISGGSLTAVVADRVVLEHHDGAGPIAEIIDRSTKSINSFITEPSEKIFSLVNFINSDDAQVEITETTLRHSVEGNINVNCSDIQIPVTSRGTAVVTGGAYELDRSSTFSGNAILNVGESLPATRNGCGLIINDFTYNNNPHSDADDLNVKFKGSRGAPTYVKALFIVHGTKGLPALDPAADGLHTSFDLSTQNGQTLKSLDLEIVGNLKSNSLTVTDSGTIGPVAVEDDKVTISAPIIQKSYSNVGRNVSIADHVSIDKFDSNKFTINSYSLNDMLHLFSQPDAASLKTNVFDSAANLVSVGTALDYTNSFKLNINQGRNLLLWSGQFDAIAPNPWVRSVSGGTTTLSVETGYSANLPHNPAAPMYKLIPTGTAALSNLSQETPNVALGQQVTVSGYFEYITAPDSFEWVYFLCRNRLNNAIYSYFNVRTGQFGEKSASVLARTAVKIADGLWRFSLTCLSGTAAGVPNFSTGIGVSNASGGFVATSRPGHSGVLAGAIQLEYGSNAGAYSEQLGVPGAVNVALESAYTQTIDTTTTYSLRFAWGTGVNGSYAGTITAEEISDFLRASSRIGNEATRAPETFVGGPVFMTAARDLILTEAGAAVENITTESVNTFVFNNTGAVIRKGIVVRAVATPPASIGPHSKFTYVEPAANLATGDFILGIVTEDIAAGGVGRVIQRGTWIDSVGLGATAHFKQALRVSEISGNATLTITAPAAANPQIGMALGGSAISGGTGYAAYHIFGLPRIHS